MARKTISPADLVPMDLFTNDHPVAIDVVYACENHHENMFGPVYREDARLWLHADLAAIVLLAARLFARANPGAALALKDGLRTVEAQALMQEAPAVRRNPHWCEGPDRLLSPPGTGGHPRAMAVDIVPLSADGTRMETGTAFDHFSEDPARNPAARDYTDLPEEALANRRRLENAMTEAARRLDLPLLPLPAEWWDFRFPQTVSESYAPLHEQDLPGQMRMTAVQTDSIPSADFPAQHFDAWKTRLETRIATHCR